MPIDLKPPATNDADDSDCVFLGETATLSPHLRDQAAAPDVSSVQTVVAHSKSEAQLSAENKPKENRTQTTVPPNGAPKASTRGGNVERDDSIYDLSKPLAAIENGKNQKRKEREPARAKGAAEPAPSAALPAQPAKEKPVTATAKPLSSLAGPTSPEGKPSAQDPSRQPPAPVTKVSATVAKARASSPTAKTSDAKRSRGGNEGIVKQKEHAVKKSASASASSPAVAAEDSQQSLTRSLIEKIADQQTQIAQLLQRAGEFRQEAEKAREDCEDILFENEKLNQQLRDKEDGSGDGPDFELLKNPEFKPRLQYLVQRGYSLEDAWAALTITKRGEVWSSGRAEAHLRAIACPAAESALATANAQVQTGNAPIEEGSALASILISHPDAIDIVLRLKTTHETSKARKSHGARTAVCASNIVQLPSISGDANLIRKGAAFLGQVALAVSEDCHQCKELRVKMEREAAEAVRAKAQQEQAEARRKAENERKAKEAREQRANRPIVLNFRSSDSRRDVTLKRCCCADCGKGSEAGKWLYFCDFCSAGYHETHTEFTLVRKAGGEELFMCSVCSAKREQGTEQGPGQPPDRSRLHVVGNDIANRKAPRHQEAVTDGLPDDSHDQQSDSRRKQQIDSRPGAAPAAATPTVQIIPRTPSGTAGAGARGDDLTVDATPGGTVSQQLTFGSKNSEFSGAKAPTIQMKDYFIWDPIPKEWKAPIVNGVPQEHADRGYGKIAYQNWRRKNVTCQSSHIGGRKALGPLSRGISAEMKVAIGTQFLTDLNKIKDYWPSWHTGPVMDDASLKKWTKEDPLFSWVERIPDELLLELLDKRFGVQNADTFLSKRFPADLPDLNEQGELNYHAAEFSRWSIEWQTELAELERSSSSALLGVDQKQTLLNALSSNKLLHDFASVQTSTSPLIILATMRDWVMREEQDLIAQRNKKQSLLKQSRYKNPGPTGKREVSPGAPKGGQARGEAKGEIDHKQAYALFTQFLQRAGKNEAAPFAAEKSLLPLTANLTACGSGGGHARCEGCGNVWNREHRHMPCSPECKYQDHPDFNKDWKTTTYPRRTHLTWKDFRTLYPGVTPPAGLLAWEDRDRAWQKGKTAGQKRTGPESPYNNKSKQRA